MFLKIVQIIVIIICVLDSHQNVDGNTEMKPTNEETTTSASKEGEPSELL